MPDKTSEVLAVLEDCAKKQGTPWTDKERKTMEIVADGLCKIFSILTREG